MLRLLQTAGHDSGRSLTFEQSVVRVGRMPDGDVVFDAVGDIDASGRHAEFRQEGDALLIVDVGSRNGTFVEGRRIEQLRLQVGAEVEFGRGGPRLRVEAFAPQRGTLPATPVHSGPSEVSPQPSGAGIAPLGFESQAMGAGPASPMAVAAPHREPAPQPNALRYVVLAAGLGAGALGLLLVALALWTFGRGSTAGFDAAVRASSKVHRFTIAGMPQRCVAFPVAPELLATTAGCVISMEQAQQAGAFVLLRSADGSERSIEGYWRHPNSPSGVDIGLVQVPSGGGAALPLGALQEAGVVHVVSDEVSGPFRVNLGEVPGVGHWEQPTDIVDGTPVFDDSGDLVGMSFGAGQAGAGVQDAAAIRALVAGLAAIAPGE